MLIFYYFHTIDQFLLKTKHILVTASGIRVNDCLEQRSNALILIFCFQERFFLDCKIYVSTITKLGYINLNNDNVRTLKKGTSIMICTILYK